MAGGILYGSAYGAVFESIRWTQHGGEIGIRFLHGLFNIRSASAFGRFVYANGDAIHVGTVGTYNSSRRLWIFQDYSPVSTNLAQLNLTRNYIYGRDMPATLDGVRMKWHETHYATISANPFRFSMPVLDNPASIKIGELITSFAVDTSGSAPVVSAIYKSDQILTLSDYTIGTGGITGVQLDGEFRGTYAVTNLFANEYTYNPSTGLTNVSLVSYLDGTAQG